ncbi:MAG TPA: hypothetical protein ENI27_07990 [bacterium]|nr:hypothetical protein [bacterium]
MDRLPKRKELVFGRVRKEFYLRLVEVIRELAYKFCTVDDRERVRAHIDIIAIPMDPAQIFVKTTMWGHIFCVCSEIRRVISLYQLFYAGKNGDGNHTRKIKAGIERLKWLVENWDDLEIVGNIKNGYGLELKT